MKSWADLHLHTRWSDGTLDLGGVVCRAKEVGLSAIAITDHDTIGPELRGPWTELSGMEVITGVEVKAEILRVKGEILGYFVDPGCPAMQALFSQMAQARRKRMEEMVRRCREVTGLPLTLEEVQAKAVGSLGRPHLAAALLSHGAASSLTDAFTRFLGDDAPCYVPLLRPSSAAVIAAIRESGGVAALAHPGFLPVEDWEAFLSALKSQGLQGVEIFYPYEASEKPINPRLQEIPAVAKKFGLIATGGSDDHGPGSVKESIGLVRVSYAVVEELRRVVT